MSYLMLPADNENATKSPTWDDDGGSNNRRDYGERQALLEALCSDQPQWFTIVDLVQRHGAIALRAQCDRSIFSHRLYFTYEKWSPLHFAAIWGRVDVARLFVARGADLNALASPSRENETLLGRTPLFCALDRGPDVSDQHMTVAEALVEDGADVNLLDAQHTSLVHVAALRNRPQAIHMLADNGASVDSKTKWGWTPLHEAAWLGNIDCVKALLCHSADAGALAPDGSTPAGLAKSSNNFEILEILLQHTEKKRCISESSSIQNSS